MRHHKSRLVNQPKKQSTILTRSKSRVISLLKMVKHRKSTQKRKMIVKRAVIDSNLKKKAADGNKKTPTKNKEQKQKESQEKQQKEEDIHIIISSNEEDLTKNNKITQNNRRKLRPQRRKVNREKAVEEKNEEKIIEVGAIENEGKSNLEKEKDNNMINLEENNKKSEEPMILEQIEQNQNTVTPTPDLASKEQIIQELTLSKDESHSKEHSKEENAFIEEGNNPPAKKSYLDIIKEFIDIYDRENQNQNKLRSGSYSLVEDLKIVYQIAMDDNMDGQGPGFWNKLINRGIFFRTCESLRDRYRKFLRYLQREDFDKIITYLKTSGIGGFLIFSKNKVGNRIFKAITINDPLRDTSSTTKRDRELKNDANEEIELTNKYIVSDSPTPTLTPTPTSGLVEKYEEEIKGDVNKKWSDCIKSYENLLIQNSNSISSLWELNPENITLNEEIDNFYSQIKITSYLTSQTRIVVQDMDTEVSTLHEAFQELSLQYNISQDQLVEDLVSVSGFLEDLKKLIEKKHEYLRWLPEDDQVLENAQSEEDDAFKMLVRYKGNERVRNRIKFLGIEMNFKF